MGGLFLAAMVDSPAVAEGEKTDGKAIFLAQKCNMCHAVPSAGIEAKTKSEAMKGPDVAGLDGDAEQLAKYLRKQAKIDGKDHKKEFKGGDDELKVLIDWVLKQ